MTQSEKDRADILEQRKELAQVVAAPLLDSAKAKLAQNDYCSAKGLPHFAPSDGRCYRCNQDIYTLITVEKASSQLITGCPHCAYSFCD